jgi:DNA-binding CsgD family transcriptional regulator
LAATSRELRRRCVTSAFGAGDEEPVTAPDLAGSLTPNERNVVGLVAEGLSKPQIGERLYVSRQTVQTHLVHVFAKLDISSRAQIAGEAARREERTP